MFAPRNLKEILVEKGMSLRTYVLPSPHVFNILYSIKDTSWLDLFWISNSWNLVMFSSIKSGLEELEAGPLWESHMCGDEVLWITQSFLVSNK